MLSKAWQHFEVMLCPLKVPPFYTVSNYLVGACVHKLMATLLVFYTELLKAPSNLTIFQ